MNAAEFAREHGVSVRTVYRHQARIRAEGQWQPHSKRPRSSPRVTPPELDAWICKLRTDLGMDNGADFIRDALIELHEVTEPAWQVPARSTINRVLARHGLLARNPAKRPRNSFRRFAYARPRDCYQIDATNIRLTDGSLAAVFEVLDDCTRTLLACHAAPAETADGAITAITQAFDEYGLPAIVLSDNGTAFTSRLTQPGSISTFTQCLLDHAVRPINSSPYHPQTLGKCERLHQTADKLLAHFFPGAAGSIAELQARLDTVREHYASTSFEHTVQPKLVYISNPTELGTLYTKAELESLSAVCRARGLYLFVDGARLGYGLAAPGNDVTMEDLANLCDVFYIGGTKVGALFGEAVVITNPALQEDFRYLIKQHGGMLAKGRLLGVQFDALMEDDLYEKIAAHADRLADKLRHCLKELGVPFLVENTTNQLFPVLPDGVLDALAEDFVFSEQERVDETHRAVRFCTSWATKEESVDALCIRLRQLLGR